jgi:hypothetical protein
VILAAEIRGDILDKILEPASRGAAAVDIGTRVLPLPTRERASGLRRATFGISALRISALSTI